MEDLANVRKGWVVGCHHGNSFGRVRLCRRSGLQSVHSRYVGGFINLVMYPFWDPHTGVFVVGAVETVFLFSIYL